jgi:polyferredoxin
LCHFDAFLFGELAVLADFIMKTFYLYGWALLIAALITLPFAVWIFLL